MPKHYEGFMGYDLSKDAGMEKFMTQPAIHEVYELYLGYDEYFGEHPKEDWVDGYWRDEVRKVIAEYERRYGVANKQLAVEEAE